MRRLILTRHARERVAERYKLDIPIEAFFSGANTADSDEKRIIVSLCPSHEDKTLSQNRNPFVYWLKRGFGGVHVFVVTTDVTRPGDYLCVTYILVKTDDWQEHGEKIGALTPRKFKKTAPVTSSIDLKGLRCGTVVATEWSHRNPSRGSMWRVRCDCGNTDTVVSSRALKSGSETITCNDCNEKRRTLFRLAKLNDEYATSLD